jgi:hypothetical protein
MADVPLRLDVDLPDGAVQYPMWGTGITNYITDFLERKFPNLKVGNIEMRDMFSKRC